MDLWFMNDETQMGLAGVNGMLKDTSKGISTVYQEGRFRFMRGKNVKVTYMGNNKNKKLPEGNYHLLEIDGEFWEFKDYVSLETLPLEIENLCDVNYYFNDFLKTFKN